MVVDEADIVRVVFDPAKDDAPLVIDPDAVKTTPVAEKRLKPVTRRRAKVVDTPGRVDHIEFSPGHRGDGWRKAADTTASNAVIEVSGGLVAERSDQSTVILPIAWNPCNHAAG